MCNFPKTIWNNEGNMLPGKMLTRIDENLKCDGYKNDNTIVIEYNCYGEL